MTLSPERGPDGGKDGGQRAAWGRQSRAAGLFDWGRYVCLLRFRRRAVAMQSRPAADCGGCAAIPNRLRTWPARSEKFSKQTGASTFKTVVTSMLCKRKCDIVKPFGVHCTMNAQGKTGKMRTIRRY